MGNELLESTTHGDRSGSDPSLEPRHASQPHATTIRHATRHKHGNLYLAQVVTIIASAGFVAYFQVYKIHDNGRTTLQTEASYSTEAAAVDRWLRWLKS